MDPAAGAPIEWYYVGHYGQLGPLTLEQVEELVRDGVIERDTFVWHTGLGDWLPSAQVPLLKPVYQTITPASPPPPPPPIPGSPPMTGYAPTPTFGFQTGPVEPLRAQSGQLYPRYDHTLLPVSDRNRVLAGVLQIVFPGTGRMYLGYWAQGILQLLLIPFGCGVGLIWSLIDGILMLTGSVKLDGYGRRLPE